MKVFQCSHSGLLLPPDYQKGWGTKYGIGLGPNIVSECVDVNYTDGLPRLDAVQDVEQLSYPTGPTFAQVDAIDVPYETWEDVPEELKLILRKDDPRGFRRAAVIRAKQLENPKARKLLALRAQMAVDAQEEV